MKELFIDSNDKVYTDDDVRNALVEIGIEKAGVLFLHTDIMFGRLCSGIKRNDYLESMYEIINSFNIPLIIPTFTYSFCNGEEYDVINSKTSMGVLNEYIRKKDGYVRTEDPLLSVAIPKHLYSFFENLSHDSLGPGSAFDRLHDISAGVCFLFFGAELSESFTYVHHVEKVLDVPYRFDMPFTGSIINAYGEKRTDTYSIHTQCKGVKIPSRYDYFENQLLEKGLLKKQKLGDKSVSLISEKDAYTTIYNNIINNRFFYVEEPYNVDNLVKEYTYDRTKGRITHC